MEITENWVHTLMTGHCSGIMKMHLSENEEIKSIGMAFVFLLANIDKLNAEMKKLQAVIIKDIINNSNELEE